MSSIFFTDTFSTIVTAVVGIIFSILSFFGRRIYITYQLRRNLAVEIRRIRRHPLSNSQNVKEWKKNRVDDILEIERQLKDQTFHPREDDEGKAIDPSSGKTIKTPIYSNNIERLAWLGVSTQAAVVDFYDLAFSVKTKYIFVENEIARTLTGAEGVRKKPEEFAELRARIDEIEEEVEEMNRAATYLIGKGIPVSIEQSAAITDLCGSRPISPLGRTSEDLIDPDKTKRWRKFVFSQNFLNQSVDPVDGLFIAFRRTENLKIQIENSEAIADRLSKSYLQKFRREDDIIFVFNLLNFLGFSDNRGTDSATYRNSPRMLDDLFKICITDQKFVKFSCREFQGKHFMLMHESEWFKRFSEFLIVFDSKNLNPSLSDSQNLLLRSRYDSYLFHRNTRHFE